MAYEFTRENHVNDGEAWLINKKVTTDEFGVPQTETEERHHVFTQEGGIVSKEFFNSRAAGITSQKKITIFRGDYHGEKTVELLDEYTDKMIRYTVYRTYPRDDFIEIYLRDDIGEWEQ